MIKRRTSQGQSLVEVAIIFPIVLFLLLGFFDLGRAVFYYASLSNAVREGTRAGIVNNDFLEAAFRDTDPTICPLEKPANPDEDSIRCVIYRYSFALTDGLKPVKSTITVVPQQVIVTSEDDYFFETLTVNATYCFQPVTPGIRLIFGSNTCTVGGSNVLGIPINAESTMQVTPYGRSRN
jgi:hypothetical protein